MSRNIVEIFSRGNQELFHSAFLAWLLDDREDHGLGRSFRSKLLRAFPGKMRCDPDGEYEIRTEAGSAGSRFDILLSPVKCSTLSCQVVLENKVKSFGSVPQLEKYARNGREVGVLALLPETLDSEIPCRYPVLNYGAIRDILKTMHLDVGNPYQFIVQQYVEFLENTLGIFDTISAYCDGSISFEETKERWSRYVTGIAFRENDIRTFTLFYFYRLAQYIHASAPDLKFGTLAYAEAKKERVNTKWHFEKNMQGPPFMESILYNPIEATPWTMQRAFWPLNSVADPIRIAPRIEIRLNPVYLVEADDKDPHVGYLMLGTWTDEFKKFVRSTDPYDKILKRRGDRNFHFESVSLSDLPFARITERLRQMMQLIFDRA